jgi:DNA repair photolyase
MRSRPAQNPPNPWLGQQVEWDDGPDLPGRRAEVTLLEDATREILSRNDSFPELGWRWSLNPYRGCLHACAYCYARPYHEYLGLGAGTDFDTRIVVKRRAPALLRAAFERTAWRGERIAFSGATDAWQPLESKLGLTRACLAVCAEYRNPVSIVTKSALIERDLDLLVQLAQASSVRVAVSLPFLDPALARALEPWAPSPERRLRTIAALAAAGLSPAVLVAPVVPGLDDEVPRVLAAAREAGAAGAHWAPLRLPGSTAAVFEARVRDALPDAAGRILHLVAEAQPRPGRRVTPYAATIAKVFEVAARRHGLGLDEARDEGADGPTPFRRPREADQLPLFS